MTLQSAIWTLFGLVVTTGLMLSVLDPGAGRLPYLWHAHVLDKGEPVWANGQEVGFVTRDRVIEPPPGFTGDWTYWSVFGTPVVTLEYVDGDPQFHSFRNGWYRVPGRSALFVRAGVEVCLDDLIDGSAHSIEILDHFSEFTGQPKVEFVKYGPNGSVVEIRFVEATGTLVEFDSEHQFCGIHIGSGKPDPSAHWRTRPWKRPKWTRDPGLKRLEEVAGQADGGQLTGLAVWARH